MTNVHKGGLIRVDHLGRFRQFLDERYHTLNTLFAQSLIRLRLRIVKSAHNFSSPRIPYLWTSAPIINILLKL